MLVRPESQPLCPELVDFSSEKSSSLRLAVLIGVIRISHNRVCVNENGDQRVDCGIRCVPFCRVLVRARHGLRVTPWERFGHSLWRYWRRSGLSSRQCARALFHFRSTCRIPSDVFVHLGRRVIPHVSFFFLCPLGPRIECNSTMGCHDLGAP